MQVFYSSFLYFRNSRNRTFQNLTFVIKIGIEWARYLLTFGSLGSEHQSLVHTPFGTYAKHFVDNKKHLTFTSCVAVRCLRYLGLVHNNMDPEFLKNIFQHCEIKYFPQFGSCL